MTDTSSAGAPLEDVKSAFRRKALEHHPDRGGDPLLRNNKDGRNAAQMAAQRGRGDVLRELAGRKIDPQLRGVPPPTIEEAAPKK